MDFQLQAFLYFLYSGFFFSCLHSMLHFLFRRRPLSLRLIADFLLAVILCFMIFLSIYFANADKLRLYMLFAFLLGMGIYRTGIGGICKMIASFIHKKGKSSAAANNTSME